MTQEPREDRTPAPEGGGERLDAVVREQDGGANVVERPDRSRIQESEDDGALGLTRTGQDE